MKESSKTIKCARDQHAVDQERSLPEKETASNAHHTRWPTLQILHAFQEIVDQDKELLQKLNVKTAQLTSSSIQLPMVEDASRQTAQEIQFSKQTELAENAVLIWSQLQTDWAAKSMNAPIRHNQSPLVENAIETSKTTTILTSKDTLNSKEPVANGRTAVLIKKPRSLDSLLLTLASPKTSEPENWKSHKSEQECLSSRSPLEPMMPLSTLLEETSEHSSLKWKLNNNTLIALRELPSAFRKLSTQKILESESLRSPSPRQEMNWLYARTTIKRLSWNKELDQLKLILKEKEESPPLSEKRLDKIASSSANSEVILLDCKVIQETATAWLKNREDKELFYKKSLTDKLNSSEFFKSKSPLREHWLNKSEANLQHSDLVTSKLICNLSSNVHNQLLLNNPLLTRDSRSRMFPESFKDLENNTSMVTAREFLPEVTD